MCVGRSLVHARLDYWIMSQDCKNAFPWHELLNWWIHKMRPCSGWQWQGCSMQKLEPIARLNIRRLIMVKQGCMYSKQNWKWMLARLWKDENIASYVGYSRELGHCFCNGSFMSQPPSHSKLMCSKLLLCPIWLYELKMPKSLSSKVSDKNGRENQTKTPCFRSGVEWETMKITWNVGSVNGEERSYGEVKNFPRLLLGEDVKPAGLIVTLGGDWGVHAHKTC